MRFAQPILPDSAPTALSSLTEAAMRRYKTSVIGRGPVKVISDIHAAANARARDADNWIGRLHLLTDYLPTVQGRARRYTYANALELAYLAALVDAGVRPAKAVPWADHLRRQARNEELASGNLREWLVFPAQDQSKAVATDDLGQNWLEKFSGARAIKCIPARAIRNRVDKYFAEQAWEEE